MFKADDELANPTRFEAGSSPATSVIDGSERPAPLPDELVADRDQTVPKKRVRRKRSRPRKKTISPKRLARRELHRFELDLKAMGAPADIQRPRTRGECANVPRPCPFATCKHHLYLDITETGSLTINFPELEIWELPPRRSCALDVADDGGHTLESTAEVINLTRERIRQIELKTFMKLKPSAEVLGVESRFAAGTVTYEPQADGELNMDEE